MGIYDRQMSEGEIMQDANNFFQHIGSLLKCYRSEIRMDGKLMLMFECGTNKMEHAFDLVRDNIFITKCSDLKVTQESERAHNERMKTYLRVVSYWNKEMYNQLTITNE